MFKKTEKLSDLEKQAQLKDLKVVTLLYLIKIIIVTVLVNLILIIFFFFFGRVHALEDGVLVALCTLASFLGSFIDLDDEGPNFFFRNYFPPSLVAIQKVINQQIKKEENRIKYLRERIDEISRQHKDDIPLYCEEIKELENNINTLKRDALVGYEIIIK